MSNFNDREKAQENKYAFDKEQEFKITARRNKLLGLWAAELLHLSDEEAEKYAKEVVMSDFEEPGDDDVFRKIKADFLDKAINISDDDIRDKMAELMGVAREQIAQELQADA